MWSESPIRCSGYGGALSEPHALDGGHSALRAGAERFLVAHTVQLAGDGHGCPCVAALAPLGTSVDNLPNSFVAVGHRGFYGAMSCSMKQSTYSYRREPRMHRGAAEFYRSMT